MKKKGNARKEEVITKDSGNRTVYHFIDTERDIDCKSKVILKKQNSITVYPFYYNKKQNKVLPKYGTIKSLTFEGFNKKIPSGFIKEAYGGYGVSNIAKPIIKFIQKNFELNSVTISKKKNTQHSGKNLIIKFDDFDALRKRVASVTRASFEKNKTIANNYFASTFKKKFKNKKDKYQRGFISLLTHEYDGIEQNLSPEDKTVILQLFNTLSAKKKGFFEKQELVSTRETIEKKFIEDVIKEYQRLLKRKSVGEERWQNFFKDNSWIFSQLFAYPTVLFRDKAYVGGKSIDNKDGNVVDFLYTNKLTRNSSLIEIKKHTTKLLSKKPYRGSDVFSMDKEFSGAISQALDQKETYTKDFDSIRKDGDIVSFNPKCIVIAGMVKNLTTKQYKAFELLRANMKDVDVITFDELYERIEAVLKLFTNNKTRE